MRYPVYPVIISLFKKGVSQGGDLVEWPPPLVRGGSEVWRAGVGLRRVVLVRVRLGHEDQLGELAVPHADAGLQLEHGVVGALAEHGY